MSRFCLASKWYISMADSASGDSIRKAAEISGDNFSRSHQLLSELGFIVSAGATGLFNFLPLATKAINKLVNLIDEEMTNIGAQKLSFSSLVRLDFLEKSGRLDLVDKEIFRLKDRFNTDFCLAPTHEESLTCLFSPRGVYGQIAERRLPLYLYQITPKYRDESNPRHGLLRTREFLMKDLYTCDISDETALRTFGLVENAYKRIIRRTELPVIPCTAATGTIGGSSAREFHVPSPVGEDTVFICSSCLSGVSKEAAVLANENDSGNLRCDKCRVQMERTKSIEVAHLFHLGHRYSEPFNARYTATNNELHFLNMGCYGIGVTRLFAAAIEHLSLPKQLRIPLELTPFKICVIGPKRGSREARSLTEDWDVVISESLSKPELFDRDVILDDRHHLTVGYRVYDAKRLGIPFVVVASKSATRNPPEFEVIDVYNDETLFLDHISLLEYLVGKKHVFCSC